MGRWWMLVKYDCWGLYVQRGSTDRTFFSSPVSSTLVVCPVIRSRRISYFDLTFIQPVFGQFCTWSESVFLCLQTHVPKVRLIGAYYV
jgi:hypothetical protein